MKIVKDKKEIIKVIGEWTTTQIESSYVLGSTQIELKHNGEHVIYENDDVKNVAYIAMQCHAINQTQYASLLN